METRILFCNVAYMKRYDGMEGDKPVNGGAYVVDEGDAYEKYNFHVWEDGYCRGFVETGHHAGYKNGMDNFNELNIDNISPAAKKQSSIDHVLVIFCAKPLGGKTVIVGWYKDATVYRRRPVHEGVQYNLMAKAENCYLLPEQERRQRIPQSKDGGFGFGRSNLRYVDFSKHEKFIQNIITYIETKEIIPLREPVKTSLQTVEPEVLPIDQLEFFEGDKKVVTHTSYERSREARETCLRRNGTRCIICDFDSATIYGEEFADKIHVHHIIPISQVGTAHQVNASYGLLPVCPNCHMILHTKMPNGEYISWMELKKRYESRNK